MSPGPEMPLSGRWFPTPAPMDDATKEIVWEFFNPQRAGEHNELIAAVYEVVRLPENAVSGWMSPAPPQ